MKVSKNNYVNRKLLTTLGMAALFMFIGYGISFGVGVCPENGFNVLIVDNKVDWAGNGKKVQISDVDLYDVTNKKESKTTNKWDIGAKMTGFNAYIGSNDGTKFKLAPKCEESSMMIKVGDGQAEKVFFNKKDQKVDKYSVKFEKAGDNNIKMTIEEAAQS